MRHSFDNFNNSAVKHSKNYNFSGIKLPLMFIKLLSDTFILLLCKCWIKHWLNTLVRAEFIIDFFIFEVTNTLNIGYYNFRST